MHPLKVAIDVSGLSGDFITGIGVYTQNLINSLLELGNVELSGTYKISRIRHRKSIAEKLDIPLNFPDIPYLNHIITTNLNVFHGTDYWIPIGGNFKKIVTIHDLAIYQEGMYSQERRAYSVAGFEKMLFQSKPDYIITVSDFIKNEFLTRFPQFENKIATIYHGCDHLETFSSIKSMFEFPYIVSVGTIEARKNILNMFYAFVIANEKYPDLRMVIIGGFGGYMGEEIYNKIKTHPKSDKVVIMGFVAKQKISAIIQYAVALIYPSIYEGFGFPILEGMRLGVPIITSNFGAMTEIAGNACLAVDTLKIDAIAEAINQLMQNSALKYDLIQKGTKHSATFTWAKCAKNTKKIYDLMM